MGSDVRRAPIMHWHGEQRRHGLGLQDRGSIRTQDSGVSHHSHEASHSVGQNRGQ